MTRRVAEITVYLGRSDANVLEIAAEDPLTGVRTPLDLSAATRMVLTIVEAQADLSDVVIDSASPPTDVSITWQSDEVTLRLGALTTAVAGSYDGRLVVYDGTAPNGQQLIHEEGGHAGRLRMHVVAEA